MFVLTKIFGDYPQVKILEVFADHFDEELSILDIAWLTDIPKTTINNCISKLLEAKILLEVSKVAEAQLYHLNNQKQEVQIIVSLVNYIVSESLDHRLEERGLKQLEEHETIVGENNMDHIQMLVSCAYMRGVPDLQHRTIAEFAQFVEDVMSDKPEYQKYKFDWNSHDAIEKWIEMFHKHCKECYRDIEERLCIDEEYL